MRKIRKKRRTKIKLENFVVHCKHEQYDIYIGRPSIYGNPYSHKEGTLAKFKVGSREEAISKYKEWIENQPHLIQRAKQELKGKILGCWCSPKACHGDILVKIANEDE